MKYFFVISVFFILTSCTRFLIGEIKMTHDSSTPYIKPVLTDLDVYKKAKFFIIPTDSIKECRGYPSFYYVGNEHDYSFFRFYGKLCYKDEIVLFAVPDSICVNKYPNTIDDEDKIFKGLRFAKIVDNKIFVEDSVIEHVNIIPIQ